MEHYLATRGYPQICSTILRSTNYTNSSRSDNFNASTGPPLSPQPFVRPSPHPIRQEQAASLAQGVHQLQASPLAVTRRLAQGSLLSKYAQILVSNLMRLYLILLSAFLRSHKPLMEVSSLDWPVALHLIGRIFS